MLQTDASLAAGRPTAVQSPDSRTTLIAADGSRLVVEPSHTFRNVRIWTPRTGEIVTIPMEIAKAVAQAIEAAALAIHHTDLMNSAEG